MRITYRASELTIPIHVLEHEQVVDSAGAGEFRGGMGHIYRVQYLTDIEHGHLSGAGMFDYSVSKGLSGGNNPNPITVDIHHPDGQSEKLYANMPLTLKQGDIFEFHNMGGAGFGDGINIFTGNFIYCYC